MKKVIGALALSLLILAGMAHSAAAQVAVRPVVVAQSEPATQLPNQQQAEVQLLRAQNALLSQFQSDVLSTVYWALGTVAALGLLLFGFGWFANFKFHESEKKSLSEEFDRKIDQFRVSYGAELTERQAAIIEAVTEKMDVLAQRIQDDVTKIDDRVRDALGSMGKEVKALERANEKRREDRFVLAAEMRLIEQDVWEIKGIYSNVVLTQVQALEAALEAGRPVYVGIVLKRVKVTLERDVLPKGVAIYESTRNSLREALKTAAKHEPVLVEEIRKMLDEVPIKS